MDTENKDNLTDIVENLPEDRPEEVDENEPEEEPQEVIADDGDIVTLGE